MRQEARAGKDSCVMPIPYGTKARLILNKIKKLKEPILEDCYLYRHPSGTFHCQAKGAYRYFTITGNFFASGRGICLDQARFGSLMELSERYSAFKFLANLKKTRISSFDRLKNNIFTKEHLLANCADDPSLSLVKPEELSGFRLGWQKCFDSLGNICYLPLRLIADFLEGSNGIAAGFSLEDAMVRGLLEVIERDSLARIESAGLNTALIDDRSIEDSQAKKIIQGFLSLGHSVFIRDFSLGRPLPMIGVARKVDPSKFLLTVSSGLTGREALLRALTENAQIESGRFNLRLVSKKPRYFSAKHKISIKDLPNIKAGSSKQVLDRLKETVSNCGMAVFFCDVTDEELGIPVAMTYLSPAKVVSQKEEGKDFIFGLIDELLRVNDKKGAGLLLKRAKFKDRTRFLFYRGNKLIAEDKKEQALCYFRQLLKENCSISRFKEDSLYWLGLDAFKRQDKRKAKDYLTALVKIKPGSFYPAFFYCASPDRFFKDAQQLYLKLWLADNYGYIRKFEGEDHCQKQKNLLFQM